MKELQNTFILAICLLAFTTVVFFFKYGKERAQSKALEAENIASQTLVYDMKKRAEQRAEEAERLSKIAKQSAEANMLKAKQAREMLEKSKRQSELTQKELVKKLNAQLEREADARIAAENASKELQKQRDILRLAVADAKSALDELKKKKQSSGDIEIARMQDLLAQREAEIERLKKRQSELERLRIEAEDGVIIPSEIRGDIEAILSEDPRPQYHHDDERVYGISYSGYNIKFRVKDKILTIVSIESIGEL